MNELNSLAYQLLDSIGVKPKASFSQNFLTDIKALDDIENSLPKNGYEHIVEIGPGLGFLTERLMHLDKQMTVIELDKDMVEILGKRFPGKFEIIEKDIKKTDLNVFHVKQTLFVGNLPYNITKEIVEKFAILPDETHFSFMVQKEVGEKLVYIPGKTTNCPLGAFLALEGEFTSKIEISKHSFSPAPKVDSTFMNYHLIKSLGKPVYDFIKKIYRFPKKTLANNLKSCNVVLGDDLISLSNKRPHELTVEQLQTLVLHYFPSII